jgi:hypothetical protein
MWTVHEGGMSSVISKVDLNWHCNYITVALTPCPVSVILLTVVHSPTNWIILSVQLNKGRRSRKSYIIQLHGSFVNAELFQADPSLIHS